MQDFNIENFKNIATKAYGDIELEIEVEGDTVYIVCKEDKKALIIGKSGRNINSLRELVRVYNKLYATNFDMEVKE